MGKRVLTQMTGIQKLARCVTIRCLWRKDEVLNIIDMFKVTERIKGGQDIPLLNHSSRLLFTLSTFLCAVTSTNPEFFSMQADEYVEN